MISSICTSQYIFWIWNYFSSPTRLPGRFKTKCSRKVWNNRYYYNFDLTKLPLTEIVFARCMAWSNALSAGLEPSTGTTCFLYIVHLIILTNSISFTYFILMPLLYSGASWRISWYLWKSSINCEMNLISFFNTLILPEKVI